MKRKQIASVAFGLVVALIIVFASLYRGADALDIDPLSSKNVVDTALFFIVWAPIIYYLMKKKRWLIGFAGPNDLLLSLS